MAKAFETLCARWRDMSDLRYAEAVLGWDQQTYMPAKGNDARSRQMALLTSLAHEKLVAKDLGTLLERLLDDASLDEESRAAVREAKRDRDRAVKLPTALVRELSETAGKAHVIWVEARAKRDFALYAPILEKLVELKRREAEAIGYEGTPYDTLLDQYEPGASVKTLDPVLMKTRDIVVEMVRAIARSSRHPRTDILTRRFPPAKQEKLGLDVLTRMGFDFQSGRLDLTVHPFTTNFDVNDVRITTHYEPYWLPAGLFSIIHEGGHALYEMGLPAAWAGTPLGEARSLGIHESQSRFWENTIGRSLPFWRHAFPLAQKLFPKSLGDISLDEFHFAINAVTPSFIRIEADEITYNLHILVRYEVEKALFVDKLPVADAPALWNDLMRRYLGITPAHDADGILQDVHWSFGGFGYFPTYLLGNLYAAQWRAALRKEVPDMDARVARGELLFIKEWLNRKIHQYGRRYSSTELCTRVSGEPLNPLHFKRYLHERFDALYGLKG